MYFSEDKTVSVIRAGAVLESSNSTLDVGGACRVREKGKVYHGIVVTYGECTRVPHNSKPSFFDLFFFHIRTHVGTKDDVVNVEEQYLSGIYMPSFLDELSDADQDANSEQFSDGSGCELNTGGEKHMEGNQHTSKKRKHPNGNATFVF